jgi:hypothetical protein
MTDALDFGKAHTLYDKHMQKLFGDHKELLYSHSQSLFNNKIMNTSLQD